MENKHFTYLYEDKHILVIQKPAGLPVQSAALGVMDLESLIKNHLAERRITEKQQKTEGKAGRNEKPVYLGIVHRLDQPVEGVLVFARTPAAAAHLSAQVQDGRMKKEYLALVLPDSRGRALLSGLKKGEETILEDDLIRDGRTGSSRVAKAGEKNAKKARLFLSAADDELMSLSSSGKADLLSPEDSIDPVLLRIRLLTGRHHQIRVQLAHAGLPIAGDRRYGRTDAAGEKASDRNAVERRFPALCAYRLTFLHPVTGKQMSFLMTPSFLLF